MATKVMQLLAGAALRGYLGPKLAEDAKFNVNPLVAGVTAKTWAKDKPRIVAAMDAAAKATKGNVLKLAADADLGDAAEMLSTLDAMLPDATAAEAAPADGDPTKKPVATDDDSGMVDRVAQVLATMGLTDEQVQTIMAAMKPEVKTDGDTPPAMDANGNPVPPKTGVVPPNKDDTKDMVSKPAMDAALKQTAEATRVATMKTMREISQAEKDILPHYGEVKVAMDSAADVYKLALDAAGIDLTDVHPSAFKSMVSMLPKSGDKSGGGNKVKPAMDAAANSALNKKFPTLGRIGHAG